MADGHARWLTRGSEVPAGPCWGEARVTGGHFFHTVFSRIRGLQGLLLQRLSGVTLKMHVWGPNQKLLLRVTLGICVFHNLLS